MENKTISGVKNVGLPDQRSSQPKPGFQEHNLIGGRSLFPALRYKTYLPLGGSGHSRGHVAKHGVIHIGQRARRTERKDIYITLISTRTGEGKEECRQRTSYGS